MISLIIKAGFSSEELATTCKTGWCCSPEVHYLNLYCTFPIQDFVDRFLANWLVNRLDKTTSEHECALRTVATENLKRKGFLYTLKDGAAISHMRSVPDAYLLG
jgi:hypothetical protein